MRTILADCIKEKFCSSSLGMGYYIQPVFVADDEEVCFKVGLEFCHRYFGEPAEQDGKKGVMVTSIDDKRWM